MIESTRPRRRRPATRGLLFGASLDRVPSTAPAIAGMTPLPRSAPVPIALVGASTPVAPAKVVAYGAMAATWPLVERSAARGSAPGSRHGEGTLSEGDRLRLLGG